MNTLLWCCWPSTDSTQAGEGSLEGWAKVLPDGFIEGEADCSLLPRVGGVVLPVPIIHAGRRRSHVRAREGVSDLVIRPPGFSFEIQSCSWKVPKFGAQSRDTPLESVGTDVTISAGVTLASDSAPSVGSTVLPRPVSQLKRKLMAPVLEDHLGSPNVSV